MEDPGPQLRAVDPATGEVPDTAPATYGEALARIAELENALEVFDRKFHGALSQIGKLEKDHDAEARASRKWPRALAVFRYWQELTGHGRAQFTTDRFHLVAEFLDRAERDGRDGSAECRSAIRGLVASDYHMKRGRHAGRPGPRYDDFFRAFASSSRMVPSQDVFEAWQAQDPQREAEPSLSQRTLIEHAREVAGRLLERAELIRAGDGDAVACSHLLLEIDRLNRAWLALPYKPDTKEAT